MNTLWSLGESLARSILPTSLLDPLDNGHNSHTSQSLRPHKAENAIETLEPFPPLPRELVLRILSFTLPPPTDANLAIHYRKLLDYSKLDKDCSRWASRELRRHVRLRTPQSALRFSKTIDHRGKTWSRAVRTLRIGHLNVEEESMVGGDWMQADMGKLTSHLLAVCPQVDELWLAGAKDLELSSISNGLNLRKLYIFESRIVPSFPPAVPPFRLPRLELLHLKAVICTGTTLHDLLSPASLPILDTLDFFSVHQSLVNPRHDQLPLAANLPGTQIPLNLQQLHDMFSGLQTPAVVPSPLPSSSSDRTHHHLPPYFDLAPRIKHLSLGPYSTRTIPLSALPHFTSLVSLSIPRNLFLSPLVEPVNFAPTLEGLRITSAKTRSDELEEQEEEQRRRRRRRRGQQPQEGELEVTDRWYDAMLKTIDTFELQDGGGGGGGGEVTGSDLGGQMKVLPVASSPEPNDLRVRAAREGTMSEQEEEDEERKTCFRLRLLRQDVLDARLKEQYEVDSEESLLLYEWKAEEEELRAVCELGQEKWRAEQGFQSY